MKNICFKECIPVWFEDCNVCVMTNLDLRVPKKRFFRYSLCLNSLTKNSVTYSVLPPKKNFFLMAGPLKPPPPPGLMAVDFFILHIK